MEVSSKRFLTRTFWALPLANSALLSLHIGTCPYGGYTHGRFHLQGAMWPPLLSKKQRRVRNDISRSVMVINGLIVYEVYIARTAALGAKAITIISLIGCWCWGEEGEGFNRQQKYWYWGYLQFQEGQSAEGHQPPSCLNYRGCQCRRSGCKAWLLWQLWDLPKVR